MFEVVGISEVSLFLMLGLGVYADSAGQQRKDLLHQRTSAVQSVMPVLECSVRVLLSTLSCVCTYIRDLYSMYPVCLKE
jgi:hypothetical protein